MTATEPSDWVRAVTRGHLRREPIGPRAAGGATSPWRAPRLEGWSGRDLARVATAPILALASGFAADRRRYSGPAAVRHALRASRILAMGGAYGELTSMPAFQGHAAANGEHDPLFFLAHPHYLARGFTARQRLQAALTHYRHESAAFVPAYIEQVYARGGLVLWQEAVAGIGYDVRLMPGHDVLYEGGLSLVLHVDGACVCVMSFSLVPTRLVLSTQPAAQAHPPLRKAILFVTRKQLTSERGYQAAFNKAFDRTTPAHLCFGALAGLARALGHHHVLGIDPEKHPSFCESKRSQFETAYADFWTSLAGRRASSFGYLIDVPTRMTPLENLDASRRKRAKARRAHMDAAERSAGEIIGTYMRADERDVTRPRASSRLP